MKDGGAIAFGDSNKNITIQKNNFVENTARVTKVKGIYLIKIYVKWKEGRNYLLEKQKYPI